MGWSGRAQAMGGELDLGIERIAGEGQVATETGGL